jgi:hypothetical protein
LILPCHRIATAPSRPVRFPAASLTRARHWIALLGMILSLAALTSWPGVMIRRADAQVFQGVSANGIMMQQQNGIQVQMPMKFSLSRRSGLSMTIDSRWANNYGYRPIEVTVRSPKPATADRLITVQINTGWWGSQRGSMSVEQDFELLKGSTVATALVACPQYQLTNHFYWWNVWVDGVKDRDLSRDKDNPVTSVTGMTAGPPNELSILVVGPVSRQRWLTAPNSQEFEALSLPATMFPQRWIDYTCLDVISLSRAELQNVAKANATAVTAIRRWVETGGQLWINDAGPNFEHLAEVSQIFGVPATILDLDEVAIDDNSDPGEEDAGDDQTQDENDTLARAVAWRPIRFGRGGPFGRVVTFLDLNTGMTRVARDRATIEQLERDPNYAVTNQSFEPGAGREKARGPRGPRDSSRWFVDQSLGLGNLRAFRGDQASILSPSGQTNAVADPNLDVTAPNNARGPRAIARSPLRQALRATRRWDVRHGMRPDGANHDFAKLLVPGVGLAPVTEFQVLITVFVLLIGPLNYWLLKRYNRLQLLVLTVPLAAVLLTSSLFAYAILSDGFGTTIRVQSFTTLNQRTGDAACWARSSYYAGLAPGDGLTMPDDVAVYPIIPGWNDSGVDASIGAARELIWEDSRARMTRGWLRSRTPMQYLTVRARKSPHRIELNPAGGKIRTFNQLGTGIHYLLVLDDDGNLFAGENLTDRSKSVLEPIERTEAIRKVRELFTANRPEAPPALAAEDSDFQIIQRRQTRRMMSRRYGLQYSEQRLDANLLSDALADLAGTAGQPALSLPPRSYLAITEIGPEVVLGVPSAEEQASFHVVVGRW